MRNVLSDARYVHLDAVADDRGKVQRIPVGGLGRPAGSHDGIANTCVAGEFVDAGLDDRPGYVDQHDGRNAGNGGGSRWSVQGDRRRGRPWQQRLGGGRRSAHQPDRTGAHDDGCRRRGEQSPDSEPFDPGASTLGSRAGRHGSRQGFQRSTSTNQRRTRDISRRESVQATLPAGPARACRVQPEDASRQKAR